MNAAAPQLRDGICRNCSAAGLGWAGWAGLGWAGHEDQHFINITSLPPRRPPPSCPAPARWPVSSSKSPEVNEFSVLLKHNDHMTLPYGHRSL